MPTGIYDRKYIKVLPQPIREISETERSYLAGIIDGEGSIMVIHHNSNKEFGHKWEYWVLRVLIANTDKRLLDWLLERFGGGYSIGISKKNTHKDTYQWRVDSKRALPVLMAALPYLILKKEQANLALDMISTHKLVGRKGHTQETFEKRKALAERIKSLNKRGKPEPKQI